MKFRRILMLAAIAVLLAGCGKPVPPEKAAYVGEWQEKTMYLVISQDGSVRYKRVKGGVSSSVEGPLKGFHGDNFDVGIAMMSTTFVVSKAAVQDGKKWKMVVDGVELTKTSQ